MSLTASSSALHPGEPHPAAGILRPPERLHDELRGYHGRGHDSQHTGPSPLLYRSDGDRAAKDGL